MVTQALAAEPKGQPRARCCCCLFSWSSIFLYLGSSSPFCCLRLRALSASAAALSLGTLDCVSLVSRSCWYRSVVLVVTGSPVSEASARSRSLTLSGISTRPWFAAVTPSSVGVTSHEPTSRSSCWDVSCEPS